MKKNFLTVAAMMVVAFFVSTEIAKAADISFSGQIRSRWELNEHSNGAGVGGQGAGTSAFNDSTGADDFIFSSVRLAANANINDTTSAFIQLQSNRTWGNATGSTGAGGGSGNASFSANNADASVGLHQAYFTLKNFANLPIPVDMKLGRQEIKLDGWRLYGNTIWTAGMQVHDGIRLDHAHDNMALSYIYVAARENGRTGDPGDSQDTDNHILYGQYKGILGGTFSAIYSFLDDNCGGGATCVTGARDTIHTVGARQAGQLFGIDYRVEGYYQGGQANADKINANAVLGSTGTGAAAGGLLPFAVGESVERKAYMFGVRVGKTFNNVMFKPGITVWYDYLSGTSDEDARDGEFGSFNTLFDTGHKFYGLQDVWLAIGNANNQGTRGLGLQDVAIKGKLSPMPGWTLKADVHAFLTAESVNANTRMSGQTPSDIPGAGPEKNHHYLGHEVDVTLVNKYNANTNIAIGWSNFNGSKTFRALRTAANAGSADANWAYIQFDVKF